MPYLVARVEWFDRYRGHEIGHYRTTDYGREGNPLGERFNFEVLSKLVYGYFHVKDVNEMEVSRLHPDADRYADNITLIFVARRTKESAPVVVGFYRGARVYRRPFFHPNHKELGRCFRAKVHASQATLIPSSLRSFPIRGLGSANHWYGFNEDHEGIAKFESWASGLETAIENTPEQELDEEERRRAKSRQLERVAVNYRNGLIVGRNQVKCAVCDKKWNQNQPIWHLSAFEVHHLYPFKSLPEGEKRYISRDDLRVLCANCHRLIHRWKDVGDIKGLRKHLRSEAV